MQQTAARIVWCRHATMTCNHDRVLACSRRISGPCPARGTLGETCPLQAALVSSMLWYSMVRAYVDAVISKRRGLDTGLQSANGKWQMADGSPSFALPTSKHDICCCFRRCWWVVVTCILSFQWGATASEERNAHAQACLESRLGIYSSDLTCLVLASLESIRLARDPARLDSWPRGKAVRARLAANESPRVRHGSLCRGCRVTTGCPGRVSVW